jgi:hypothetical protein
MDYLTICNKHGLSLNNILRPKQECTNDTRRAQKGAVEFTGLKVWRVCRVFSHCRNFEVTLGVVTLATFAPHDGKDMNQMRGLQVRSASDMPNM